MTDSSSLLMPHIAGTTKTGHAVPKGDGGVVEVIVGGKVVSHVRQHHRIFKYGENGVHARLTVGVVSPVAVHGDQDGGEVGQQENLLVSKGLQVIVLLGCSSAVTGRN